MPLLLRLKVSPKMKKLFLAFAILSAFGFLATFPVQSRYQSKAKMIQRIQKSASTDLFGDEGIPIGAPMMTIIEDEKAYIGGADAAGKYKVDESYLTAHNIHPLQLKTVEFFVSSSRIGFGIAAALCGLFGWRLKRKPIASDAP